VTNSVRAVVLDLDGTLVNSTIDFRKMKEKMISYLVSKGADPSDLSPTETNVVIISKSERMLREKGLSDADMKVVMSRVEEFMNEGEMESLDNTTAIEGAKEACHRLKAMGYTTVILTRGHHRYAEEALRKTRMLEYFDYVLGREETPKPKPYPEALQHVADLLKVELRELVFVGDHPIDHTCAQGASVRFVAVQTGATKAEAWKEAGCTEVIKTVAELPDYLSRSGPGWSFSATPTFL